MNACTPCSAVLAARQKWAGVPRKALPNALRNPSTPQQFDIAYGVITAGTGIEPECRKGLLIGWLGIGLKGRTR